VPSDTVHDDLEAIWERVREGVRPGLPAATFELWIEPLKPASIRGSTLYVGAPASIRAWVERRYAGVLDASLRASKHGLERVTVVDAATGPPDSPNRDSSSAIESQPLDPQHTFERFVIGSGNRLGHAAALAVAELPGEAYNPLFLHGPPGLGKTHLLGAIVDYLRRRRSELTVHYTTAERFTTEFIAALRKDGPEGFKRRYRKLDALLIDDVQALEGKEHTQDEFVHTFNTLHATGKQIVLSSDRPPEALARLAERLRDRFQWGLCIELGAPDLLTRTALLWRMTLEGALDVPEPAVLREIAALAAGNVRRLEGAMTRVSAISSVLSEPVTPSLVHHALESPPNQGFMKAGPHERDAEPSVAAVQEAVCSVVGVTAGDLLSPKRTARVARARQLAIYLTRELTSLSLTQIARAFQRDHSTVLHAVRAVTARLEPGSDTTRLIHRTRHLLTSSCSQVHPLPPVIQPRASSPPTRSTGAPSGETPCP
jgi:chromosomal replication initiator protein